MTDDNDPFPEAPSYDELEEMKTSHSEVDDITEFSEANEQWYNAAPDVAARLFVQAGRESEEFREAFLSQETVERELDMGDGESTTVHGDKWRDVMQLECPEYHDKIMGLGLSAFQGGLAERAARGELKNNDK